MDARPLVIKLGGSTFGSGDTTVKDLVTLQRQGASVVVAHGGGALVTDWLKKQGVASRFVHGLRVTDSETLKVVTAVLAGLANKQLVAAIHSAGGRAVGLSGVDGGLLIAKVMTPELGYVGDVISVNTSLLEALLAHGYVVVLAPISLDGDSGSIVNVNGDVATGHVAAALKAQRLVFLTDVPGVCDRSGRLLERLNTDEAEELIASGVATGGMEVKLRSALSAARAGTSARIIDGRPPGAILDELDGRGKGTTITP